MRILRKLLAAVVLVALPGPARYAHFVKRAADAEEVWSLRGPDGWVLAGDGDRELVPVWPHARYAEAAATGEWDGAAPAAIALGNLTSR